MKQVSKMTWMKRLTLIGLTVTAVAGGAGTAAAAQTGAIEVAPPVETGIAIDQQNPMGQQDTAVQVPAQTQTIQQGTAGQDAGGRQRVVTQGSGQSQSSQGQAQGSGQSRTIVAGQNTASGQGPSIYGIVTEGEKGVVPQDSILGGATLTMFNSQTDSQILSVLLQTSQGSLIVVDGGLGADAEYLRNQILARGGHVSAWLVTHTHGDHVGALYEILMNPASGVQIDAIYYSFAAPEWYAAHDAGEVTMAQSIITAFSYLPQEMLHPVSRGQYIQVDDVLIQVLNDRYELASDSGNNAGIVYKMLVNGVTVLFLGDMAEEGGNRLLAEVGPEVLKSDIVQMAHHGQHGVSEAVYQAINPSICLWPTPKWLWENSGNRYQTPQTKNWMSHLNVQKHYCMKDGDQVIR